MGKLTVALVLLTCFIYFNEQVSGKHAPPPPQQQHSGEDDHDDHHGRHKEGEEHKGKYDESEKEDKEDKDDDCGHHEDEDGGIKKCKYGSRRIFICIGTIVIILVVGVAIVVTIYKCNQRRKQVSDSTTNLQEKKVSRRAENYIVATQDNSTIKPPLEGPVIVPSSPSDGPVVIPSSPPPAYDYVKY